MTLKKTKEGTIQRNEKWNFEQKIKLLNKANTKEVRNLNVPNQGYFEYKMLRLQLKEE